MTEQAIILGCIIFPQYQLSKPQNYKIKVTAKKTLHMAHWLSRDPEPYIYPTFKMYRHSLPPFGFELCKALTQQTKNEH